MENIQKCFEEVLKEPKKFLEADQGLIEKAKNLLKQTYDFTKTEEIKTVRSQALPELIIKNFDLEQIWQQIELQNNSLVPSTIRNIKKLLSNSKDKLIFKNLENILPPQKENEQDSSDIVQVDDPDDEQEEEENVEDNNDEDDEFLSGDEILSDENDDQMEKKKSKSSIVDDEFFKLSEMEAFLKSEEKKMDEPDSGNDSDDDDEDGEEDNDIDLFHPESDDDDADPAKIAKFKDFFVAKEQASNKPKRNKFLENLQQENDDDDDDDVDEEENRNEQKSSFELRQERLNRKITEMEEQAIQNKPWQLKGEISAESRPQNSLLEEVVEFDMTTRPAPVITEQTTLQLEDVIKQRIKDKVFDSVERKAKPVDTPIEYKKKLVLDQEKSKESLAQIYEKEYLEQKAALENEEKPEEVPELHNEIEKMMKDVFHKLDSLSNFHFTPKPVMPELKIVNNLPAITMEEVAPVSMSEANLLAPEEIKTKPKGDVIGENERTKTDKNRERRQKKLKQKYHATKQKQQLEANTKNTNKTKTKKDVKELIKQKNINKMEEGSTIKSSKSFFTQLEDEVKTQIKTKTAIKRKQRNDKVVDAKKLKF